MVSCHRLLVCFRKLCNVRSTEDPDHLSAIMRSASTGCFVAAPERTLATSRFRTHVAYWLGF